MTRNASFSFQSGTEAAIPAGDRTRLRSAGRRAGCQMRTFEPVAVDYKATAEEAERVVSAWRQVLDIQLAPDRVSKHLAALKHWSKGLTDRETTEALWL